MKDEKFFDNRNPGWMNAAEIALLKKLCSGKGDVLEVGCYCGRSTRAILESAGGLVVSIDPLHRNGWMPRWPVSEGMVLDAPTYMAQLVREHPQRLLVFPVFSNEVFRLFRRNVDVLFIDADHSYQSTLNEIDAFAPLVNDTGWLILDDFDLEPVASAWRDSKFRQARPWLVMDTFESLGYVHVVKQEANNPPAIEGTPVSDVAPTAEVR